jgi:hypothetical protein
MFSVKNGLPDQPILLKRNLSADIFPGPDKNSTTYIPRYNIANSFTCRGSAEWTTNRATLVIISKPENTLNTKMAKGAMALKHQSFSK